MTALRAALEGRGWRIPKPFTRAPNCASLRRGKNTSAFRQPGEGVTRARRPAHAFVYAGPVWSAPAPHGSDQRRFTTAQRAFGERAPTAASTAGDTVLNLPTACLPARRAFTRLELETSLPRLDKDRARGLLDRCRRIDHPGFAAWRRSGAKLIAFGQHDPSAHTFPL